MKTKLTKEVKEQLREWAREHRCIPNEIVGRKKFLEKEKYHGY
jgi:hypothetical protein